MRIVKEAKERKNEILDAANELFMQKGFDAASIADILEKTRIARGTLYYHFKSKEDIMDALIDRSFDRILSAAQEIAVDQTLPVTERMIRVVMALKISDNSGKELVEHMHKPQNALMHQKMQSAIISGVTPILSALVSEGIEQELFRTPFPFECMEMVMTYASTAFDDDNTIEMTEEARSTRIQAFIFNIERLLHAESGSLMCMLRIFGSPDEGNDD